MRDKKILVDINHPAHVHLFKGFIAGMKALGYEVLVTAKDSASIKELLQKEQISFITVGQKKDSMILKYLYELFHLVKVWYIVQTKQVDYGIGVSMVLPLVSKLTRMKSIALDDDDLTVTPLFGKFVSFADVILNPSPLAYEDRGPNRICHNSFHELAYLHPSQFTPDPAVVKEAGLVPGEPFFILRFNAFKAHHDGEAMGISLEQKLVLIDLLRPYGRVFITTEREPEPALKQYQLPVSPDKIHSFMYYAMMFIGDSQTMISEAALLGTPAVKMNTFAGRLSIPNELENTYQLCYSFHPTSFEQMLEQIDQLLRQPDVKAEWSRRKEKMLADKIDLTSFLIWFVANYPESVSQMKMNTSFSTMSDALPDPYTSFSH
ncbi:DUF354 domain-containing protein [Spirosoma rigui]|uniref:DUF354 domain-containing protein n=1 Tax=Spirosoma rigui TaxID=564064 RepID=UPI0009AFD45A|nr:DUF354 domain-containing protein [Spirosoma rigui]